MASMIQTANVANVLLVTLLPLLVCSSELPRSTTKLISSNRNSVYNLSLIKNLDTYNGLSENGSNDTVQIIDSVEINTNSSNFKDSNGTLTKEQLREKAADDELLERVATNSIIVGFLLLITVFLIFCSLICCFRTLLFGPAELIV